MLIAVSDVRAGDVLELPRGAFVRVVGVDVYREPWLPGDEVEVEKFVVRYRSGGREGSFGVRLGDETVSLRSRRGSPVGRW